MFFKIKRSPAEVFEYLTDMRKFASIHPVITKIDKRPDGRYLVYETLKVLGMPVSFTYPVTVIASLENRTVTFRATVMRITKIDMQFSLTPSGDYTIVDEKIIFKTPLPIASTLARIFKEQHTQLFKNIAAQR